MWSLKIGGFLTLVNYSEKLAFEGIKRQSPNTGGL